MRINPQDDVRQLRFRETLRWYLRNESMLKLRKEQGYLDAQYILEVFHEVSATFAEGKIDIFNEIVERYQAGGLQDRDCSEVTPIIWQNIVEVVKLPPRFYAAVR
jgi:hypothetical protein